MSLPRYVSLIFAVLTMMLVALPLSAQLIGLFTDRIDPASEASFDRLNLYIDQMINDPEYFTSQQTDFYLNPDYIFAARDDGSSTGNPIFFQFSGRNTNKEYGLSSTAPFVSAHCGASPCTCLFDKEGSVLKCNIFEHDITFLGQSGGKWDEDIRNGKPYFMGFGKDSVSEVMNANVKYSGGEFRKDYSELAFFKLDQSRRLYLEKVISPEDGKVNIFVSVIYNDLPTRAAITEEKIEARKNYYELIFSGLKGIGPKPALSTCEYISNVQDCSKIYNADGSLYVGNSKQSSTDESSNGYAVSSGKYLEATNETPKPYCCNWVSSTSQSCDGKVVNTQSCDGVYLRENLIYMNTVAIPMQAADDKIKTCCYANGPHTFFENPSAKAKSVNPFAGVCSDNKMNEGESDVDCGGNLCEKCQPGKICKSKNDCANNVLCIYEFDGTPICGANKDGYCDNTIPCANKDVPNGLTCQNNICIPYQEPIASN